MHGIYQILLFLLGLIAGSFLSVVVDRMPHHKSIGGRSRCPQCSNQIRWYDNIPVLSYILLGAKCRSCNKPISRFYPSVEIAMGLLFVVVYFLYLNCKNSDSLLCTWSDTLGIFTLPYFLILITLLAGIFIIDLKHQIIPDELSLSLFVMAAFALILVWPDKIYVNVFMGFMSASFLLLLHLLTKGKGMGLGDVKLAIPMGMVLGFPLSIVWMSFSFIIGAIVGVILILLGKAKLGRHIAFGPFLIVSFGLTLFCSSKLVEMFFPLF